MSRRTGRTLATIARDAYAAAERDQGRARAATGLDMMPHGHALAEHVARAMVGTQTAAQIVQVVGYQRVERCADLLAACGHAPLGRRLLERQQLDAARRDWIVVSIDRDPPVPEPRPVGRPAPTADEVLWELEDAALRGASFDDVADTFGVLPSSLRRRLERLHIADQARRHFPRLGRLLPGRPARSAE